jgi:hypothetical protein
VSAAHIPWSIFLHQKMKKHREKTQKKKKGQMKEWHYQDEKQCVGLGRGSVEDCCGKDLGKTELKRKTSEDKYIYVTHQHQQQHQQIVTNNKTKHGEDKQT